jgi:hypothetical protein
VDSAGSGNGLMADSYEHGKEFNMREMSSSAEQVLASQ